jgi:hypothetical protein
MKIQNQFGATSEITAILDDTAHPETRASRLLKALLLVAFTPVAVVGGFFAGIHLVSNLF